MKLYKRPGESKHFWEDTWTASVSPLRTRMAAAPIQNREALPSLSQAQGFEQGGIREPER